LYSPSTPNGNFMLVFAEEATSPWIALPKALVCTVATAPPEPVDPVVASR
jgi:hypothetical protein